MTFKVNKMQFDSAIKALRNSAGLNDHAKRVCVYLMNKLVSNIEAKKSEVTPIRWDEVNADIVEVLGDIAIPVWVRRALARWLKHYGKLPIETLEPFEWCQEVILSVAEVKDTRSSIQSKADQGKLADVLTMKDRQKSESTTVEKKPVSEQITGCLDRLNSKIKKDPNATKEEKELAHLLKESAHNPTKIKLARGTICLGMGRYAVVDETTLRLIESQFSDKITYID